MLGKYCKPFTHNSTEKKYDTLPRSSIHLYNKRKKGCEQSASLVAGRGTSCALVVVVVAAPLLLPLQLRCTLKSDYSEPGVALWTADHIVLY